MRSFLISIVPAHLAVLFMLLVVAADMTAEESKPVLATDDRVVFLGDSITQAGDQPNGYVDLVRRAIADRHGELGVDIIGAGISGHKVPDLEARLDRDVISKKPTRVIIYIGINDVWHSQNGNGTPKDKYEAGLNNLIDRIRAAGAKVTLCTPSVIGEKTDGTNELDEMLEEYADISRKVAQEKNVTLLELRKAFIDRLMVVNQEQEHSGILTTDGVHLNEAGNRFVARQMMASLGVKPHRLLRHVVLFKFKDDTTAADLKEIEATFAGLPEKIKEIYDFEWGTDVSVENLAKGFTHSFFVTFASEADRAVYLPHPAHRAFVDVAKPHIDQVLVVDYWTRH